MKPINFFTESALTMGPALGARRVSRRKYRLFAVACCRAGFERITHPDCRALVELVERWADDESLGKEVSALRRRVHAWAKQPPFGFSRWLGIFGAYHAAAPTGAPVPGFIYPRKNRALLADIVGPIPRATAFDPAWRTSDAVALARAMYDSRDFGAMPILADALQDAGCDDKELLAHCRSTKHPHARGCWVCDLVLSFGS
jgi:hypothetical protein